MRLLPALIAATVVLGSTRALAAPKVVASVVPIHSIVAAVMAGVGTPDLLLKGSLSEHRAVFTPTQIAALGDADLVFIAGRGIESKLSQISGSDAVNGKIFIDLSEAPGVEKLPVRQGGAWEPDTDEHAAATGPAAEGVLAYDPHVWLDPQNAKAMAREVAADLARSDPANAAAYAANARNFEAGVDSTSAALVAQLAPVKNKPFIVFHDAYHYFEHRFGLDGVGSISDVSAQAPSAERLAQVRDKIVAAKAACVFREPQYDDKVVQAVIERTGAREGVLDPLGASIEPGPKAYDQLLRNLGTALAACLSGS